MRSISIYFEDEDYDELLRLKDKYSWRTFMLQAARAYERALNEAVVNQVLIHKKK